MGKVLILDTLIAQFKLSAKEIYVKTYKYSSDSYHIITNNELNYLRKFADKNTIKGRKALTIIENSKYFN